MVDRVRNAFIVAPNGDVEERAYNEKWSPVVNSLENLRDELRRLPNHTDSST